MKGVEQGGGVWMKGGLVCSYRTYETTAPNDVTNKLSQRDLIIHIHFVLKPQCIDVKRHH